MGLFKAALTLASLLLPSANAQTTPAARCAKGVHVIGVRGHGTPSGYGGLNTTVAAIVKAIPHSTAYPLPYYTDYTTQTYNFQAETTNGTKVFLAQLEAYISSCPKTSVVVVGYSEGAVVALNGLCGASSIGWFPTKPASSSYAANIIATVTYGDDTFVGGKPYDVGSCTTHGRFPRLNTNNCAAFAPNFKSYCDAPDPDCCQGNNATAHHVYPQEYDSAVVKFVVAQYAALNSGA